MSWLVTFIILAMAMQGAYANKSWFAGVLVALFNFYFFMFIGGTWHMPYVCWLAEWPDTYHLERTFGLMLSLIANGIFTLWCLDNERKLIRRSLEREAYAVEARSWLV